MASNSVTSDDKLWAALAYLFTPLVPIILMLLEDKKKRPFIKEHNMQALAWGIVVWLAWFVLGIVTLGLIACVLWLVWIPQIYWAYQAYQGKSFSIPIISNLVKNMG